MYKINFSRLINDSGGASSVARKINKARTIPYQWVKKGKCSTKVLEELKNNTSKYNPQLAPTWVYNDFGFLLEKKYIKEE